MLCCLAYPDLTGFILHAPRGKEMQDQTKARRNRGTSTPLLFPPAFPITGEKQANGMFCFVAGKGHITVNALYDPRAKTRDER